MGGLEGDGDLKFGDSVNAGKPNLQDIAEKVKKDKQVQSYWMEMYGVMHFRAV